MEQETKNADTFYFDEIYKTGYLTKKRFGNKWIKRYFVLKGNQLLYYNNHNTENSLLKGTVNCNEVDIQDYPLRDNSFLIKKEGCKDFPLCAASLVEKEDWIDTLKAVSQNQPPKIIKKEH
ncbi:dual adapter for phosphotyrosine and 3-phosphotyrosine and 3-phosphoinositide [Anaeramoeba flamelloides]|uniref:Dual adapter for phosphotyrosine and 3-phosphotyrosine and 3-phosphoinositide n=1 Tax=Anaeramoeba flamelloides TaxID=1746091 RepID=A0ABQ8XSA7_9EUKA|nr:dual adapter for phosphotyrosine and 3-phosphotyrosine and 3-phosphoinositide [Anaeramoeba flamelloides]